MLLKVKTWWKSRWRRWLSCWTVFVMTGTLMFILYNPRSTAQWHLNLWTPSFWSSPSFSPTPPPDPSNFYVSYPHPYSLILDEPTRCQDERPFLVLMIPVAPHNRDARDQIRQTWGKETTVLGQEVRHYFMLGLSSEDSGTETLKEQLLQESQTHRDILQSSFLDSYHNLTIKTMVMMEWLVSHCPNSSYAMKVDSDIFLNVHLLVDILLKAPRVLYMTGGLQWNAPVLRDRDSKWFVPHSVFPESTYPTYAMGMGYVFSMDLPEKILEASAHVKALFIEDVYVGLCLKHLGISPTDPPQGGLFVSWMPFFLSNCSWTTVITAILQESDKLSDVWEMYEKQVQSGC